MGRRPQRHLSHYCAITNKKSSKERQDLEAFCLRNRSLDFLDVLDALDYLEILEPLELPVQGAFSLFKRWTPETEVRHAPERRCSSRTFRYGYLVTT